MSKYYSNEIVFRGHPDKVCDQISAALLREYMNQDPNTRAGIEVCGGKGNIFVTGEVTSTAQVVVKKIVKAVLLDVGYDIKGIKIINNLGTQSPDIALGTNDDVGGAGDQGMMFGYACSDTKEMLPKAQVILQRFARWYDYIIQNQRVFLEGLIKHVCDLDIDVRRDIFKPDGKAQITGEYDDDFNLIKIKTFTISYQNTEKQREISDSILKFIAHKICADLGVEIEQFLINPTGKFLVGGFEGDAGLTGRKIVVDAYQSFANVGGGCMNGKDPSKVDFSAAHKARQIAKQYLKKHKLKWCEVQLSYAIGKAEPLAIYIDSNKGNIEPEETLYKECTPKRIIEDLNLKQIDYERLAMFGHFTD
jgi:S-adenosylmethionine synthetase